MVTAAQVRAAVSAVPDPELPVLTIDDLGVLRGVEVDGAGRVEVTITPTYSGCPAMDTIRADILASLHRLGLTDVAVHTVLAPAWTTDWMTEAGRHKLAELGIAPPAARAGPAVGHGPVPVALSEPAAGGGPVPVALSVRCPRCGSTRTSELSRFSSTLCKALYRCTDCQEPFDHFRAH
jgi:ring-1,2-phenylacetyl-CoA epoxidase subunit PaaD